MRLVLAAFFALWPAVALADSTIVLDGVVPTDAATHFFLPFEVPAGTLEIEVRHDDLSDVNILDWGLEDQHGFRGWGGGNTEPAVVALDRASRSYVTGAIEPGTWRVVVGKAKVTELPASYHVEVILRTTVTLAAQPERRQYVDPGVLEETARFYAGDFHVHSQQSGDAHPTLDEIATVARENGLDFVEISDHNTHTALDFFNDAQSRHPDLLFVPGVEFTTYAGHANGIGATTWVDHRIGVEGATIEAAALAFHQQGALFSINHPALVISECIGCAWKHELAGDAIDAVEIMTTSATIVRLGFLAPSIARWEALCAEGRHAVPLGGSDDHQAAHEIGTFDSPIGYPTTMVFAQGLSVSSILDGLRNGRTVVRVTGPDAPMIVLDSSTPMTADTVIARRTTLSFDVTGGEGKQLVIVKNGAAFGDSVSIDGEDFHHELRVSAPSEGEDRYRAQVVTSEGPLAITSYVWIRKPEGSGGGCVVTHGSDDALSISLVCVVVIAARLRRRARPGADSNG